jgi:RHS repeat-associated protein
MIRLDCPIARLVEPESAGTWNGGAFGYQEDATGLKLLGHRYYDSSLGRFITRDPIKDGRNWYAYCGNDPVNGVDPSGLLTIAGDTSGLAGPAWLAPGNWPSYNGLTKAQVKGLIGGSDDEDLAIWGHGMPGMIYVNETEYLSPQDIRNLARARKRMGKKKFKTVMINQCEVMQSAEMINALLELADEVNGFTCLTNEGLRRRWTKPVPVGLPTVFPGSKGKKKKRDYEELQYNNGWGGE